MLLGRMPGDALGSQSQYAALPLYATLVARYLDRFGPYRLQPYDLPAMPATSAPMAIPVPPIAAPAVAPILARNWIDRPSRGAPDRNTLREQDPVGRGLGVLSGLHRADTIDRINAARRAGLINDANRRVQAGVPTGRAGGVGTPGVGGGFTRNPGGGGASQGAKARGQTSSGSRESMSGGGADKNAGRGVSNRGSGAHGQSGRRPR